MLEFISAIIFAEFFLITIILFSPALRARQEVEKRIAEVVGNRIPTVREQELKNTFFKRVVKPLLNKISLRTVRMIPAEKEAELAQKIDMAGMNEKIAPRELLTIKYFIAFGMTVLLLWLSNLLGKNIFQVILLGCLGFGLGWYLPDLYINRKGAMRKQEIEKSLPDVLDLLTVSVEAGLGFDGALMKVVEKTKGVLSEEFTSMLQEIKMGKPRIEALRDMSNRVCVDDLSTFTGSVILADQLGISIGNVLRLQSGQIRQKRRQRAEEMAMKAPVKILIPMVFLIFPAIFVVLMGPAVIQLMGSFMK